MCRCADARSGCGVAQQKSHHSPFVYVLPADDMALVKAVFADFVAYARQDPSIVLEIEYVREESWYSLWSGGESLSHFSIRPNPRPAMLTRSDDQPSRLR